MTNSTLLVGGIDCNDRVNTFLISTQLGVLSREAEEYGGPTVDVARQGPPDDSGRVLSTFRVRFEGNDHQDLINRLGAIASELRRDGLVVTYGEPGWLSTVALRCGVNPPLDPERDALYMGETAIVDVAISRDPYVYTATESAIFSAFSIPGVVSMAAEAGDFAAPWDLAFDFATLECRSLYAGRYPDGTATIADFAIEANDLTWSTDSKTTDAAGYPDGIGNTVQRNQSATEKYADIDVTDFEPGEYLLVAKCKATGANTGTLRHSYCAAVPIPTTTLGLLSLGVVSLPTSAVRGAAVSSLRVYLAGDGANYGYVNAFFFIPVGFGGFVGWQRSGGHAHTLRFEDGMVYADDVGALGERLGGRRISGLRGALVVVAEQATPAPTTVAAFTISETPRYEQFPTSPWMYFGAAAAYDAASAVLGKYPGSNSAQTATIWNFARGVADAALHNFGYSAVQRVNYAHNPSYELDTNADGQSDGFQAVHQLGVPTYTRPAGRTGGSCQRIQYTGVTDDWGIAVQLLANTTPGEFAPGDPVTLSTWVKGSTSGCTLNLRVYAMAPGSVDLSGAWSAPLTLTGDWQRVSVTFTLPPTTSVVKGHLTAMTGDFGVGDTLDISIDDTLLEKVGQLRDYFDGSTTGGSWADTANASNSLQVPSGWSESTPNGLICDGLDDYVELPDLSLAESKRFTYLVQFTSTSMGSDQTLFSEYGASALSYIYTSGGNLRYRIRNDAYTLVTESDHLGNVCNGITHWAAIVADGTNGQLYLDGAPLDLPFALPAGAVTITGACLGARSSGQQHGAATIHKAIAFPRALSAAEIAGICV